MTNKNTTILISALIVILAIVGYVAIYWNDFKGEEKQTKDLAPIKQERVFRVDKIERNYKNIRFEDIRRVIDPKYNKLADDLSEAYYNFWKKGLSHPWMGYDVLDSPQKSKEQFDKLHGLIWLWYDVEFNDYNLSLPPEQRIPLDQYEEKRDPLTGKLLYNRSEHSLKLIKQMAKEGYVLNIYERNNK